MAKNNTDFLWQPITFESLSTHEDVKSIWFFLLCWGLLFAASIGATHYIFSQNIVSFSPNNGQIIDFFIINPALIIGTLLFFWFGFEWGFVPVYISTFVVAYLAGISVIWATVIALAFSLGLGLFALAYHSLEVEYNLRSLKSFALFVVVSFISALASAMGSFIWSFFNKLSAYDSLILWKSWWTGTFFQSIIIIGPLLFLFSPLAERLKEKYFPHHSPPVVSVKWIYSAVAGVAIILSLFIVSGYILGKLNIEETIAEFGRNPAADIMGAMEAFEIITWTSIGLIIITAGTAIFLLNNWNSTLNNEVQAQTKSILEGQEKLRRSLQEKDILFEELQHRVKNNLAQVHGLLELQEAMSENEESSEILKVSKSRIRTMSLAHEALYNSNDFSEISLREYLEKISTVTHQSFKSSNKDIKLIYDIDDLHLDMSKAIPLGLMVSEILINAHKHAFNLRKEGTVSIVCKQHDDLLTMKVSDDGSGIPEDFDISKSNSLGMIIVQNFTEQMKADLTIDSDETGSRFTFDIPMISIQK
jgi:two-component sensor histidine kinase